MKGPRRNATRALLPVSDESRNLRRLPADRSGDIPVDPAGFSDPAAPSPGLRDPGQRWPGVVWIFVSDRSRSPRRECVREFYAPEPQHHKGFRHYSHILPVPASPPQPGPRPSTGVGALCTDRRAAWWRKGVPQRRSKRAHASAVRDLEEPLVPLQVRAWEGTVDGSAAALRTGPGADARPATVEEAQSRPRRRARARATSGPVRCTPRDPGRGSRRSRARGLAGVLPHNVLEAAPEKVKGPCRYELQGPFGW